MSKEEEEKENDSLETQTDEENEITRLKNENSIYYIKDDDEDETKKMKNFYDIPSKPNMGLIEIIKSFITTISPKNPFYRISMPIMFIQPISILERIINCKPQYFLDHIERIESSEERIKKILQWQIVTWNKVNRKGINGAKPYNPILGEFFVCKWEHENDQSVTYAISEQVCHHPPVTAFHCENEKRGFVYQGTLYPAVNVSINSLTVNIIGNLTCFLKKFNNEKYEMEYPKVCGAGIFFGELRVEVYDTLKIKCEKTGYSAEVKIIYGKGGKLEGFLKKDEKKIYEITGNIDKVCYIKKKKEEEAKETSFFFFSKKKKKNGNESDEQKEENEDEDKDKDDYEQKEFINFEKLIPSKKIVKPLHLQKKNESRRNWHNVTKHILKNENEKAAEEKMNIENRQRELRKIRKEKNEQFIPTYFEEKNEIVIIDSDTSKSDTSKSDSGSSSKSDTDTIVKSDTERAKANWTLKEEVRTLLLNDKC